MFARLFLCCAMILINNTAIAQLSERPKEWKKTVTRTGKWYDQDKRKNEATHDINENKTLSEMIASAIVSEIPIYNSTDLGFETPLTIQQKKDAVRDKADTIIVMDPITGEEVMQVRKIPFPYWDIKSFKIVEKWDYDVSTGKTSVSTLGIAPMLDLYEEAGMFMGRKPLVLFKYKDILPILREYEQYHPENSPFVKFWNGQFDKEEKQATEENTSKNDKQPAK
jgi:hypothetical protein